MSVSLPSSPQLRPQASIAQPTQDPSETERAARTSECRYRIDAPNSQRREVRIFGLGAASRKIARSAIEDRGIHVREWEGGDVRNEAGALMQPPGDAAASDAWLTDLAGMTSVLAKWLEGANTVVIVAAVGESTAAVPLIAKLVQPTGVLVTGLVVDAARKAPAAIQSTVSALRAHCSMLVVSSDAEYVEDMLTALGA